MNAAVAVRVHTQVRSGAPRERATAHAEIPLHATQCCLGGHSPLVANRLFVLVSSQRSTLGLCACAALDFWCAAASSETRRQRLGQRSVCRGGVESSPCWGGADGPPPSGVHRHWTKHSCCWHWRYPLMIRRTTKQTSHWSRWRCHRRIWASE